MTRNVTEIQKRLIALGFLAQGGDDGIFGENSLAAYNHYLASNGKPPHRGMLTLAEINANLFPEEVPPPPAPRSNSLNDFFTGLAAKAVLTHLKGLPAMNFLTGQKTIVTGIVMVIAGAVSLLAPLIGLGDMPGFNALTPGEAWTSLTTGFGLIFLRNGIANETK
jgi:peptidoglycan hydrolase-like protein with peptidoglycan-binding domain